MNIKLVVFDIAGTTVCDNGNINEAFRKAFNNAGINVDAKDIDAVMGYRKLDAIKIIIKKYLPVNNDTTETIEKIHDDFTNDMVSFYKTTPGLKPLPYAIECFKELKSRNIKVALNTGFTRVITQPVLQRLGWDKPDFIDAVVCSDEVPEGRPHPFMIKKIMQQLDIHLAEKVAKVGDTEADIKEGQNSECGLVVGVTTGAYTRQQLHQYQPDHVIDSLQELPGLIL